MTDIVTRAQRALEGITEGPWLAEWDSDDELDRIGIVIRPSEDPNSYSYYTIAEGIAQNDEADARFIAAARTLVPDLINEVELLRAQLDAVRKVHERYFDTDLEPGEAYSTPEPEDVWRYDRDLRAALCGITEGNR